MGIVDILGDWYARGGLYTRDIRLKASLR